MAQPAAATDRQRSPAFSAANADVLKVIGYLQLQHGDPSQAVILFDALHALFPSDPKIAMSLALASLRSGDPQAALVVLDEFAHPAQAAGGTLAEALEPCRHLLRGQALAALGRMPEAARSMRLFIRQRRQLENPGPT